MARRLLPCLLLTLLAASAAAQTPFALKALGQNVETGSARDSGRGGWGLADTDTLTPGSLNPAALADLRYTGLIFSGYGERTTSEGYGEKRKTTRVLLPNIRLALPLRTGRLALHAGFNIKRSMQYETRVERQYAPYDSTYAGYRRYRREGTLYEIPLGLAWRPTAGLALGASYNVVRGNIDESIGEIVNLHLPSTRDQTDELSGHTATFALLWSGWDRLQLGGSYTLPYDLEFNRTIRLGGVSQAGLSSFDTHMPEEYKAGLLLNLGKHWRFGADGQFMPFSKMSGHETWEPYLRDEWTLSAGFERAWFAHTHGRRYSPPIRFGFQWRHWGHAINGYPIDEQVFSVGTGFPFRNRLGTIDISLSYALIGDEAKNGYQSRSLRLGVSITGLEPLVF